MYEGIVLGVALSVAIPLMLACGVWFLVENFRIHVGWGVAVLILGIFAGIASLVVNFRRVRRPFFGSFAGLLIVFVGLFYQDYAEQRRLHGIEIQTFSIEQLAEMEELPELFKIDRHFQAASQSVFEYETDLAGEVAQTPPADDAKLIALYIPLLPARHPYVFRRNYPIQQFQIALRTDEFKTIGDIPEDSFQDELLVTEGAMSFKHEGYMRANYANLDPREVLVVRKRSLDSIDSQSAGTKLWITGGIAALLLLGLLAPWPAYRRPQSAEHASGTPDSAAPRTSAAGAAASPSGDERFARGPDRDSSSDRFE